MYSQFVEGNSFIHRLPVLTKLICLFLYIISGFFLKNLLPVGIYFGFSVVMVLAAGISLPQMVRKTRHILVLLLVGFCFNLFFLPWQGSLVVFLRLYSIVIAAQVFTMTSRPEEIMDILEDKLHVKNEYVVSIMIALAFLPILQRVYQDIVKAQTSRGSTWMYGDIISRIRGVIPIIIPVFRFALRKSEMLGEALTIKEYSSKE